MSEPQDCLASVLLTSDSNVAPNKNQSCHDRVESICGNSTSVEILEEFRHIYEERLRKIDEETGGEGLELKLKTLTSWVNDLGEQNQMLVETVEQLEREAGGRVSLLEDRLRKSSHVALEYMSKLEEYDNQIWGLSEGKIVPMVLPFKTSNGMVQAQQTEEILKTRVTNLQNDISGLLELIRRARCEGSWDTNGIRFLEVTNEDIFGSNSHQISCDTLKSINFDGSTKPKINFGNHELDSPSWKQKSFLESEEIKGLTKKLEDVNSHLQTTLKENERLIKEIEFLSDELKSKTDRIAALSQNTSEMDKILKQTRKNLNEEIAEKHDQLVALQRCMSQLEKRVQEIDVQSYFKDAIIREMRKDMRLAQMKNELEYRITDLEATYLRLERSWDHAWEISKSTALNDLTYYQNALQEGNTGGSKSSTFDIPEKITWCSAGIKKDQEKIRELCGEIKSFLQSSQQCTVKRGVSFASPSKEDYKLQVQELQKALKQAQNGVELARKQMTKNNECVNDGKQLARHIEESRVNVVLAQAAIEETVEELEVIASTLREREEKISEMEVLFQALQNAMKNSRQDINVLLKDQKKDDASAVFLSYQSKEQKVVQLIGMLKDEIVTCDGVVENASELNAQLNTVQKYGDIPPRINIQKVNVLLEELCQQEKEVSQRYLEIETLNDKLHGFYSAVQDIHKKMDEYIQDKESSSNDQVQSELKIKKLLLELESVQDDLEQCLKSFEPDDISNSDIE